MKTETRQVMSMVNEERVQADFAVCDDCGFDLFYSFIVAGQKHSHFQCGNCGTSYCPDGMCEKGDEDNPNAT